MTSIIWGTLIGLVVALILVIVMHYTIFKRLDKKPIWLYIIVILFFAIGGAFVQSTYFSTANAAVPTPQEQIETLTQTLQDGWKNTNGGFDFEQIQKTQEDEDAPYHEDQIIGLKMYDFGSYVVFSYKNGNTYENASFYKSSNGLILDGVANMQASMPNMVWFLRLDLNSFKWHDGRNKEPEYFRGIDWFAWDTDNLISVSSQNTLFWKDRDKWIVFNKDEANKYVLQNASIFTAQNALNKFVKFGNVELISTAAESYKKINSFYNYLYEQAKGEKYNTTKLIDATSCLCLPIPAVEQSNYPIPVSKQAEYNNAEYYGVYKCNIAVELNIKKGNTTVISTKKNEDYVNTLKKDNKTASKIEVEKVEVENTFVKVNVGFTQKQTSDLTNVNLNTNPVVITFTSGTDSKVMKVTDKKVLTSGTTILLQSNKTWSYTIASDALLFDNFQGNFTLGKTTGNLSFEYYYLNNYVVASVGLNPVGSVDMNTLDLANNPVKIILTNDSHRYEFTFSDNSSFTNYVSQTVELGEYNYTILSDQLEFASTTGTLTITTTNKTMLFNCALIEEDNEISFTLTSATKIPTENQSHDTFNIFLYIPEEIANHLPYSNLTANVYQNETLKKELYFEYEHGTSSANYIESEGCYCWTLTQGTGVTFHIDSSIYIQLKLWYDGKYITSERLQLSSIPGNNGTRVIYNLKYKIEV